MRVTGPAICGSGSTLRWLWVGLGLTFQWFDEGSDVLTRVRVSLMLSIPHALDTVRVTVKVPLLA